MEGVPDFTKVVVEKMGKKINGFGPVVKSMGIVYGLDVLRESERRFGSNP